MVLTASDAARAAAATAELVNVARTAPRRDVVVELGAREGRVAAALAELQFGRTVLVDKSHPDSAEARGVAGERVSLDLRDMKLAGFGAVDLLVAKHVCGVAMDYAVRAAAAAPPSALAFAPCCYWLIDYRVFPNRAFLEDLGLGGARAFSLLTKLTQWGPDMFWRPEDETAGQMAMDILDAGRVDYLRRAGLDAAALPYAAPALAPDGALESTMLVAWGD
mmetsp:Transcript_4302/g.12981  ORF Transcript_4302/g.12981 Transcript_4302/m.12981 type:complete len:221 (-) Transcript_4302:43-705(-)